jgi:Fic family protein
MTLQILSDHLLGQFKNEFSTRLDDVIDSLDKIETPVDYFRFYNTISTVYSSKIEGEEIDFDSYFKHKFLNVQYQPDYTRKSDDLFNAYEFIFKNSLNLINLKSAHAILTSNLLPVPQQGFIRTNPMFVINSDDKIDYVAADSSIVDIELTKLFDDIETLLAQDLSNAEVLYYASYIHLIFVKIHPFQDGNGRSARLLEKWFLIEKLGEKVTAIQLEKYYYLNLQDYYRNLKRLGVDYEFLDYNKAFEFLMMTAKGLLSQQ